MYPLFKLSYLNPSLPVTPFKNIFLPQSEAENLETLKESDTVKFARFVQLALDFFSWKIHCVVSFD